MPTQLDLIPSQKLYDIQHNFVPRNKTAKTSHATRGAKTAKTIASLFAGIGGIDRVFTNVGFQVKWANEIDEKTCKTYGANFKHKIICADIRKLEEQSLAEIDILTAGFPCQAFSIAGYRKGFEDARGSVFFEIIRLVKFLQPKILFLENVKNIKSHDGGKTFKAIEGILKANGYLIKSAVLNTAEYSSIPQNRERIYILAFKDRQDYDKFTFPHKASNRGKIQEFLEKEVEDNFYYNNTKYYPILKEAVTNPNTCYQWRRKYVRENKSNLCPTLTANMGTGGHNVPLILDGKGIRKLTPRECARLQGFSDDFVLPKDLPNSALYKQIGNSVSVPVIEAIATNLKKILG